MAPRSTKRRSPGEGGAYSYQTKAGLRWYWKATVTGPDGTEQVKVKRGFLTKTTPKGGDPVGALDDMREALAASGKGGFTEPSKQPMGEYLTGWLDGLRHAPSTVASYRKNVRLHITPHIGAVPLSGLTAVRLDALYRQLEKEGRADHKAGAGLSARTTRYIHTIISAALRDAVDAGLLPANPAARAHPPTAKQAKAPEMHPWSAAELAAFLAWARDKSELFPAWWTLAYTGMRRGELLALRWRDVDLDAATITVRRSAGLIRVKGEGATVEEGPTKTDKPRVIDLDPGTVGVLRAWKKERGGLSMLLAAPGALMFGNIEGHHRQPEHFSREWSRTVSRAIAGDECKGVPPVDVPSIRLHDLRHTHATILLSAGEPVHIVSRRLGHASVVVTLTVYAHVMPGDQKRTASRFAELLEAA